VALVGNARFDKKKIAAEIGSDVPFFLGLDNDISDPSQDRFAAMRATGRGERLANVPVAREMRFIVVYPATSLSTATVYQHCVVPTDPVDATDMVNALGSGDVVAIGEAMGNRLAEPAIKLSPMVAQLLEQMWHCELPRCQLTGSGSACFSLLDDSCDAGLLIQRLRNALLSRSLGAHVFLANSTKVPQRVRVSS